MLPKETGNCHAPPPKRKKLVMALYKLNEIIFIYSVISKKVNVML